MNNSKLFMIGIVLGAVVFIIFSTGYTKGYSSGYQTGFQSIELQQNTTPSETNAVVWNTTGLYEEIEDAQPKITLGKCIHVIVEDVAGDFYFVSLEENNTVIAYGWALTRDIRLYPDFSNGVSCDE